MRTTGTAVSNGQNEKGFIMLSLYMIMGVILLIIATFYGYAWSEHQASLRYEQSSQAFFAAEGGLDQKISEIELDNITNIQNAPLGRGNFSTTYNAASNLLTVTSTVQDSTRSVVVTLAQSPPVQPRAAITVNGVPVLNGAFIADGRNHDADGNLIGGSGVFGVSTSAQSITQQGNSTICGGGSSTNQPTLEPAQRDQDSEKQATFARTRETNYSVAAVERPRAAEPQRAKHPEGCGNPADPSLYEVSARNLPTTPEAVLGVPPGALDKFKTSNLPKEFSGIVYYTGSVSELDLGGGKAKLPGSGILIIHNTEGDATLKNLRGTFKGLIIADQVEHVHGTVVGAMQTLNASKRQLGNGTGQVLYSSEALSQLPIKKVTPSTWRDLQNDPDPQTAAVTYQ